MNALLLISVVLGVTMQNVTKKMYNEKSAAPAHYFFVTISTAAAVLFFVLTSGQLSFDAKFLPYSIGFAVSYIAAGVGSVLAIASGPLSLTSLIVSFSLMLPTLYGLVFLKDPISVGFFPGLALLLASLVLINKRDKNEKISLTWVISVIFAFLGNGFCSIVQKMQQLACDGNYKNEFMIIALLITAGASLVMMFIKEPRLIKKQSLGGSALAIICGAANGLVNLLVMVLAGRMAVSLMFPIISAGGIALTYVISKVFYKEKLTRLQSLGFLLGTVSVILLNL